MAAPFANVLMFATLHQHSATPSYIMKTRSFFSLLLIASFMSAVVPVISFAETATERDTAAAEARTAADTAVADRMTVRDAKGTVGDTARDNAITARDTAAAEARVAQDTALADRATVRDAKGTVEDTALADRATTRDTAAALKE
jgi:hypothetical protein